MPTEAPFSVTGKGPNNSLVTLRGDTYQEFEANCRAALGDAAGAVFARDIYASTFATAGTTPRAAATVDATVGPVTYVGTQPTVATVPVPQPTAVAAPPVTAPPVGDPGPCVHGARVFKESQTKRGLWRRWECAQPWSRDAVGRCQAVNA